MFVKSFITFKVVSIALISIVGICQFGCKASDKSVNFFKANSHFVKETSFGGVELSLFGNSHHSKAIHEANRAAYFPSNEQAQQTIQIGPEISLFSSEKPSKVFLSAVGNEQKGRSNRYKNTIPAVYRLTLKGYSIMEYSDNVAQTWSLNKVKNKLISKPTIMLSYTKHF